jgi:hypothetical protein
MEADPAARADAHRRARRGWRAWAPGLVLALVAPLVMTTGAAAQGHSHAAHQHGVARLDVAAEAGALTIELVTPLDNLLGFERAPRSDAERRAAEALVARLRAAEGLFVIDPAARCVLADVALASAALGLPDGAQDAGDGHAELDARWDFRCAGAPPAWVEIGLFQAWRRLSRLEVQAVGPRTQRQATLRRAAGPVRLDLPR